MDVTNDRRYAPADFNEAAELDADQSDEEKLDAAFESNESLAFEESNFIELLDDPRQEQEQDQEHHQDQGQEEQDQHQEPELEQYEQSEQGQEQGNEQAYEEEIDEDGVDGESSERESENTDTSSHFEQSNSGEQQSAAREEMLVYLQQLRDKEDQERQQASGERLSSVELGKLEKQFQKSVQLDNIANTYVARKLNGDEVKAKSESLASDALAKTNVLLSGKEMRFGQIQQTQQAQTQQLQQTLDLTTMLDPALMGGLMAFQTTAPMGNWMPAPTKDHRVKQVKEIKEELKGKGKSDKSAKSVEGGKLAENEDIEGLPKPDSKEKLTTEQRRDLQLQQRREDHEKRYGHWIQLVDEEIALANQQNFLQMLTHNCDHIVIDPSAGFSELRCCWLYWLLTLPQEYLTKKIEAVFGRKMESLQAIVDASVTDNVVAGEETLSSRLEDLTKSYFDGYRLKAFLERDLFEETKSYMLDHAIHSADLEGADSLALAASLFGLPLLSIQDTGAELLIKDVDYKADATGQAIWRTLQDHDVSWDEQRCFVFVSGDEVSLLLRPV